MKFSCMYTFIFPTYFTWNKMLIISAENCRTLFPQQNINQKYKIPFLFVRTYILLIKMGCRNPWVNLPLLLFYCVCICMYMMLTTLLKIDFFNPYAKSTRNLCQNCNTIHVQVKYNKKYLKKNKICSINQASTENHLAWNLKLIELKCIVQKSPIKNCLKFMKQDYRSFWLVKNYCRYIHNLVHRNIGLDNVNIQIYHCKLNAWNLKHWLKKLVRCSKVNI